MILLLSLNFQDQAQQHDHALQVVKEELESEVGRRADLEKKLAELEKKLGQAAEENAGLRQEIEEHESAWADARDKLQEDLKASNAKFEKLVSFINDMVASLFGKFTLFRVMTCCFLLSQNMSGLSVSVFASQAPGTRFANLSWR